MSEHRPVTQACDPLSLAPRGVCVCVCVCVCACACGAGAGQRRPTSLDSGRAGTGRRSWTSSPSRSCRVARSVVRNPLATARFAHPRAAPFLRPCVPCRLLLPACACLLHCCVSHTRTLLLPPLASACVCVCARARARARISQGAICEKMRGYLRLECSECNKFFTSEADRLRHTVCRPPCPCLSCVALRPCPRARESACLHGRDVSLSPPPILLPARP